MKTRTLVSLTALLSLLVSLSQAEPLGTAFTYNGRLIVGADPVTGSYDFRFLIYDAASGGTQQGSTVQKDGVSVDNGLFTATLDFGEDIFTGLARWLEIRVQPAGGGGFTTMAPRQPITPAPYALYAPNANSAVGLSGTLPTAQLSGKVANGQLVNNSITVTAGTGLSGGGSAALGGSTTLNNAGVLSVSGNADITASTASGAVTLGSTATDLNTASTIVKRNASGNFSAGSITLNGVLNLPTTTADAGAINIGGNRVLHAYGTGNSFVGGGAGNFTMTGTYNAAHGVAALFENTSGSHNTAIGNYVLYKNTTGQGNTANGYAALNSNTNGSSNTAMGGQALWGNRSGGQNTATGNNALYANTTGHQNTATGNNALYWNTTGHQNTAACTEALRYNTTGNNNIALGYYAGAELPRRYQH